MPDPNEELEIFESATEPEVQDPGPDDDEVIVPDAAADQLVSSAISSLQREHGGPSQQRFLPAQRREAQPPARQQPGQGQNQNLPPELQGVIGELRAERQARQALEKQIQELRQPRQPEPPFNQRVFEDPENSIDGRVRQHIDPIAQHLQTMQTDFDMRLARATHGAEAFDEAYSAWFEQVGDPNRPDPQNYWAVMNSASPGEAVVEWYAQQQLRSEAGPGGLKGLKDKIRRELMAEMGLADSAPPARTNGRGNGQARESDRAPNGQFRPRHEVRLPTPTSRMGHSSREAGFSPEDGSEEAIFDFGRAKPQRR